MNAFRPIGLMLFDASTASGRRPRDPQRPLDALADLTKSLSGRNSLAARQQAAATTLPDFLSAAVANLAAPPATSTTSTSGAFAIAQDPTSQVRVTSVATAASARSQGFTSLDDKVTAGTLSLTLGTTSYALNIAEGATLKDVVAGIKGLGAPIDATVDSDGGQLFLSVKNRSTGFALGGTAADALTVNESDTGATGKQLGLAVDHQATNAVYTLRGNTRTSTDNQVTDDISGATIDLSSPSPTSTRDRILADHSLLLPGQRGFVGGSRQSALVSVDSLAQAAEVQSGLFGSEHDQVGAGTLSLNVEGKATNVTINSGDTLADVRRNIENSGANVTAKIVTDGSGVRLSITSRASGYPLKGRPEDALTVTSTTTGDSGQSLSPSATRAATNAAITVNGTQVQSRTNTVQGALPGLTLTARHVSSSAELVALPGAGGTRPPIDVENQLNRVLQAQLLSPRAFGLPDASTAKDSSKDKDETKSTDALTGTSAARKLPGGGNESSRRDILQKLTAVDEIFGGLRAARALLSGATGATAATGASADAQQSP